MYPKLSLLFLTLGVLLGVSAAYEKSDIVSARIETCRGCSLNRLPEVKKFIMEDAPSYKGIDVKFITGATPELILLGKDDQELDRINLSGLNRKECNSLVEERGFTKKSDKEEF